MHVELRRGHRRDREISKPGILAAFLISFEFSRAFPRSPCGIELAQQSILPSSALQPGTQVTHFSDTSSKREILNLFDAIQPNKISVYLKCF